MLLIAPLFVGHPGLHRVDVLAAALPGGLSAYLAGGGSTHCFLLVVLCLGSVADSLRIDKCSIRDSGSIDALGQAEEKLLKLLHRHPVRSHERFRSRRQRVGLVP